MVARLTPFVMAAAVYPSPPSAICSVACLWAALRLQERRLRFVQGPRARRHHRAGRPRPGGTDRPGEDRGRALFCCANAASDVTIECREVHGAGDIPIKKVPCRVTAIERLADDVIAIKLQLPATERMQYLAGQYVEFLLRDGKRRSYSIATPPHEDGPIELHIRHMPGAPSPTTCSAPGKASRP